jgi:hypothetical protein
LVANRASKPGVARAKTVPYFRTGREMQRRLDRRG